MTPIDSLGTADIELGTAVAYGVPSLLNCSRYTHFVYLYVAAIVELQPSQASTISTALWKLRVIAMVVLCCWLVTVQTWATPDLSVYHRTDELLDRLKAMAGASGGKLEHKMLHATSTDDSTDPGASGTLQALFPYPLCAALVRD